MTWNDRLSDEEWGTIQWLEGFPGHGVMKNTWPTGPNKLRSNHSLVDLLEANPQCVVMAEKWVDGGPFPGQFVRDHSLCVDHVEPGGYMAGIFPIPAPTDAEPIYSEEYTQWRLKKL